ncbi:hypothetical protein IQ216_13125 [Cyanobium sp. LEGE 06143]|jgi:hypothetical protein|uniref:hypothetical protein n=1 Tax=Cyanobium sp. LEGE 06143 TaxID=945727 RepID=UPI00188091F5|nr:hypothetical protein [Cyanobium sp. LEGE 06143]MBE9154967.1 hypothetical protein [Cyanobium sp. LEGE 06113]MBE9173976.1 hypothetical protein [Cyanobium sp. LEGE 06143]
MANPYRALMLGLAVSLVGQLGQAARAQRVITGGCPMLVPESQRELQPKRLPANQVRGKNELGCLSPHDAVYGADGCPLRLCGPNAGVIQLPEP